MCYTILYYLMCQKRGDTVGDPRRAEVVQFELIELILVLNRQTILDRAIRADNILVSSTPS